MWCISYASILEEDVPTAFEQHQRTRSDKQSDPQQPTLGNKGAISGFVTNLGYVHFTAKLLRSKPLERTRFRQGAPEDGMADLRLLLVDDDDVVLFTLAAILERHGFEVSTALDVFQALHMIGSKTFDILLSDLHLPHLGEGVAVMQAMRKTSPQTALVLWSGSSNIEAFATPTLLQADEFLLKPIEVRLLVDILRKIQAKKLFLDTFTPQIEKSSLFSLSGKTSFPRSPILEAIAL